MDEQLRLRGTDAPLPPPGRPFRGRWGGCGFRGSRRESSAPVARPTAPPPPPLQPTAEALAATTLQAHARRFLARRELRRQQCADLRALWDTRDLAAALAGWAAAAARRRAMRARALALQLAYGKWAHRYLARSFDGAPIFSAEGKNAMADAFCRWRRAVRALFLWFEAAAGRPGARPRPPPNRSAAAESAVGAAV